MNGSKLLTDKIEDALGLTATLDCHSFDNVELSPLLFDLFLVLLLKTKGNETKRRKLIQVIGEDRVRQLLSQLSEIESSHL
jgi:hypothetical protein